MLISTVLLFKITLYVTILSFPVHCYSFYIVEGKFNIFILVLLEMLKFFLLLFFLLWFINLAFYMYNLMF